MMPSGQELLIIVFVIVLLFGGKKIPEFAKGLGKSIREFKKASQGGDDDEKSKESKPKKDQLDS